MKKMKGFRLVSQVRWRPQYCHSVYGTKGVIRVWQHLSSRRFIKEYQSEIYHAWQFDNMHAPLFYWMALFDHLSSRQFRKDK